MKASELKHDPCPIARASAELITSPWAFVIIRELSGGNKRFNSIQDYTGMSPRSLSMALNELQDKGIVTTTHGPGGRNEYELTQKGRELVPVLYLFGKWGTRWTKGPSDETKFEILHTDPYEQEQHEYDPIVSCATCGVPLQKLNAEELLKHALSHLRVRYLSDESAEDMASKRKTKSA